MTLTPTFFTISKNFSLSKSVLNPGIDSSLSMVPPVCPKPLPLIFATLTPKDATIGEIINVVLSPTPPVLCLSTFTPGIDVKSTVSPDFAMHNVNEAVSSAVIPLK